MVRYRRNFLPGGTFFFTVTLADRQSTLLTDQVSLLRDAFRKASAERPFEIDAIVVLPDHLHAILTLPEGDADFPHRWRRIKSIFTKRVLYHAKTIASRDHTGRLLWQRRYWEHTIRDETDFSRHVDYIHFNPTKHGLVSNPLDWPHSSLHHFARLDIITKARDLEVEAQDQHGEPAGHDTSPEGPTKPK
jgi:putative transposase